MNTNGFTVWFTGLPCSGKSTLGRLVEHELEERRVHVEVLDGDEVRNRLSKGLGFAKEDRDENIRRISFVARAITRSGGVAIACAISPYTAIRDEARREIRNFVEVYVECPLDECIKRDVKGMYKKALAGEIANFTGISDPYEPPSEPEVVVNTGQEEPEESLQKILSALERLGYLTEGTPSRLHRTDSMSQVQKGTKTVTPISVGDELVNRDLQGDAREAALQDAHRFPRLDLDPETATDAVNIATGVFSPLEGFMGASDLRSVVHEGRLSSGIPWTIPIVLDVDEEQIKGDTDTVCLYYQGELLALLDVTEVYRFDPQEIAYHVFGTTDANHPGVARTLSRRPHLVAGVVRVVADFQPVANRYYLRPRETRSLFEERGWRTVAAFQTRNVPHLGHEYVQKSALTLTDGLFINPVIGRKKRGDFRDDVILETYEALIKNYYPSERVAMSILPTEMRYAGPREAIFHAIVRKNYGCTHFIVGRDHAGVGSYYAPYAAHEIFQEYPDLGITPIFMTSFFFCKRCGSVANEKVCPHSGEDRLEFSATVLRDLISQGRLPEYDLIRREVAEVIQSYENPFVE